MTSDLKLFWGDVHNHNEIGYGHGSIERSYRIAQSTLDFSGEAPFTRDYTSVKRDVRQNTAGVSRTMGAGRADRAADVAKLFPRTGGCLNVIPREVGTTHFVIHSDRRSWAGRLVSSWREARRGAGHRGSRGGAVSSDWRRHTHCGRSPEAGSHRTTLRRVHRSASGDLPPTSLVCPSHGRAGRMLRAGVCAQRVRSARGGGRPG